MVGIAECCHGKQHCFQQVAGGGALFALVVLSPSEFSAQTAQTCRAEEVEPHTRLWHIDTDVHHRSTLGWPQVIDMDKHAMIQAVTRV